MVLSKLLGIFYLHICWQLSKAYLHSPNTLGLVITYLSAIQQEIPVSSLNYRYCIGLSNMVIFWDCTLQDLELNHELFCLIFTWVLILLVFYLKTFQCRFLLSRLMEKEWFFLTFTLGTTFSLPILEMMEPFTIDNEWLLAKCKIYPFALSFLTRRIFLPLEKGAGFLTKMSLVRIYTFSEMKATFLILLDSINSCFSIFSQTNLSEFIDLLHFPWPLKFLLFCYFFLKHQFSNFDFKNFPFSNQIKHK